MDEATFVIPEKVGDLADELTDLVVDNPNDDEARELIQNYNERIERICQELYDRPDVPISVIKLLEQGFKLQLERVRGVD